MIGFYDSGIGGLTILEQILQLDRDFPFVYLADTAIMPLGDKSIDFIQNRVKLACEYLFNRGCGLVLLACNTASVNSIRHIQQVWLANNFPNKQVLSVTKPLIELMESNFAKFKLLKGLLLSTQASHNSGFYQYELIKSGFTNITSVACPGLADAIESGNSYKVKALISDYITQNNVVSNEIEFVVLACTHYKWAYVEIKEIFPQAIIVEPSSEVATKLLDYIQRHPEYSISRDQIPYLIRTGEIRGIESRLQKLNLDIKVFEYDLK